MDNQEQNSLPQTKTAKYAGSQSSDQHQPDISVQNPASHQIKLPVVLGILFLAIFLPSFTIYFFLTKKIVTPASTNSISTTTKTSTTTNIISSETSPIIQQIQTRPHISDQKTIGQSGNLSSGFLDPIVFSKKTSNNNSFQQQVFAVENNLHPFLFYIVNKTKIDAFDIATGKIYILFNLGDASGISQKNGTGITKAYFLNNSKKIIFQLQERLDNNPDNDQTIQNNLERFKISFKIYDIATKQLTEIISTTGTGGSIAGWSGLSISPDQNYIFMFYNNQETTDPFADIPAAPNSGNRAASATYFFYNLQSNNMHKFKLSLLLSGPGTIPTSWQEDSSSVFLSYTKLVTSLPSSVEFIKIFPDGHSETIIDKKSQINSFEKSQYVEPLKKVFYVASETSNSNASQFGDYDVSSQSFTPITPQNYNSLNFIYDYSKGFVYDIFQQTAYDSHSGGITNRALYYYDLQTQTSKKILDQNLNIINFNGDYSHLLVSANYNNNISQLYDLAITTGELQFLNFAPIVFSPYVSDIYTSETLPENNLPTIYPTISQTSSVSLSVTPTFPPPFLSPKPGAETNNIQRKTDLNTILNAIYQFSADNKGSFPPGIPTNGLSKNIASAEIGSDFCKAIVPNYMPALPKDPATGSYVDCTSYITNYQISIATVSAGNRSSITVSAPHAELNAVISVTR